LVRVAGFRQKKTDQKGLNTPSASRGFTRSRKSKIGAAALLSAMVGRSNPFRVLGTPGPEGQLPVKRPPKFALFGLGQFWQLSYDLLDRHESSMNRNYDLTRGSFCKWVPKNAERILARVH
jgi:hypothetical protein